MTLTELKAHAALGEDSVPVHSNGSPKRDVSIGRKFGEKFGENLVSNQNGARSIRSRNCAQVGYHSKGSRKTDYQVAERRQAQTGWSCKRWPLGCYRFMKSVHLY